MCSEYNIEEFLDNEDIEKQIRLCVKKYGNYIKDYEYDDFFNEGKCTALEALREWQGNRQVSADPIKWAQICIVNRFRELAKSGYHHPDYYGELQDEILSAKIDPVMSEYMYSSVEESNQQSTVEIFKRISPKHVEFITAILEVGIVPVGAAALFGKKIQRISQINKEIRLEAQRVLD